MAGQMGKMSQKNAQNEALAQDYENRKTNYVNNLAIDYARYQNEKIDYQVNSDIIFRQFVAKYFGDQTRINQLQAVDLRSQEQALTALAKKAYAGPLTGVTGARLAAQPLRAVGLARSAQVAQLTERTEAIQAGSEFGYEQVLNKIGLEYGKVAMAPVAGFEPLAPTYDTDAELGSFAFNLVSSVGMGYLQGKSLMPGNTTSNIGKLGADISKKGSIPKLSPTPQSFGGSSGFTTDFFDKFPSGNNFMMDSYVTPLSSNFS